MPCPDIRPLSEVPELNGIGLGNGILPNSDVPAIENERWLEGNGGVIRFYSQGPTEADHFSPEGVVIESIVEDWWLRRVYSGPQMTYGLDLVCNRMDFRGIPINHCEFDLSGLNGRISGEGIYVAQHVDCRDNRIVQVEARSLSLSSGVEGLSFNADELWEVQIGG